MSISREERISKALPRGYKARRVVPPAEGVTDPALLPPDTIDILMTGWGNRRKPPVAIIYHYDWNTAWVSDLSALPRDLIRALESVGLTIKQGVPQEHREYQRRVGLIE